MSPSLALDSLPRHKTQTAPADLDNTFKQALKHFYTIQSEIGFLELCRERSISHTDTAYRHYWQAVADYAAIKSEEDEDNGIPERATVINELVAAAPDYVFKQDFLDKHSHDHEAVHHAKEVASYFNGLLRLAAESWPDMTVAVLSANLVAATQAVTDQHIRASAEGQLSSAIRGAQHEVIFGQLLGHTNRRYHATSIRQDLKGVDYTVVDPHGHAQYIDVKTSMHDIYKYGGNEEHPYATAPGHHLVMFSLVHDSELDGTFYLPEELAAKRGTRLQQLLDESRPRFSHKWKRHSWRRH